MEPLRQGPEPAGHIRAQPFPQQQCQKPHIGRLAYHKSAKRCCLFIRPGYIVKIIDPVTLRRHLGDHFFVARTIFTATQIHLDLKTLVSDLIENLYPFLDFIFRRNSSQIEKLNRIPLHALRIKCFAKWHWRVDDRTIIYNLMFLEVRRGPL